MGEKPLYYGRSRGAFNQSVNPRYQRDSQRVFTQANQVKANQAVEPSIR
jgi:hypothetical protein